MDVLITNRFWPEWFGPNLVAHWRKIMSHLDLLKMILDVIDVPLTHEASRPLTAEEFQDNN